MIGDFLGDQGKLFSHNGPKARVTDVTNTNIRNSKEKLKTEARREEIRMQFEQMYRDYGIVGENEKLIHVGKISDEQKLTGRPSASCTSNSNSEKELLYSESQHHLTSSPKSAETNAVVEQSSSVLVAEPLDLVSATESQSSLSAVSVLHRPSRIFLGLDGTTTLDDIPLTPRRDASRAPETASAPSCRHSETRLHRPAAFPGPGGSTKPPSLCVGPPDQLASSARARTVASEPPPPPRRGARSGPGAAPPFIAPQSIERWDCLDRLEAELRGGPADVLAADPSGIGAYLDACRRAGAAPQRGFLKQAAGPALRMRHVPLGVRGGGAVCCGVAASAGLLVEVDLYGCAVGAEGCRREGPRLPLRP